MRLRTITKMKFIWLSVVVQRLPTATAISAAGSRQRRGLHPFSLLACSASDAVMPTLVVEAV